VTRCLATLTEANAWVHFSPESFMLHFPYISTIWQTEEGQVWVEVEARARLLELEGH